MKGLDAIRQIGRYHLSKASGPSRTSSSRTATSVNLVDERHGSAFMGTAAWGTEILPRWGRSRHLPKKRYQLNRVCCKKPSQHAEQPAQIVQQCLISSGLRQCSTQTVIARAVETACQH